MAKRRERGYAHDVELEMDGKQYAGTYSVESGAITVRYSGSSKATQLGASSAERLARILLRELVIESAGN